MKESDTSFVGDKGEQLYRDLEDVPYDFDSMYPSIISESLKCVGQSKSCPPVYIGNSLLSSLASLMGNAVIKKSKNHIEPIVLWTMNLGMRGSGKVS